MRSYKRQVPDMTRVHQNFFLLPTNLQIEAVLGEGDFPGF